MACRKCGSDWTTPKGKDCNRCPHCDKQQLFQARKSGRWVEPVVVKQCVCCGRDFEAIGPKQIKQRVLCGDEECAKQHRKDGLKRRDAGVYMQRQVHGVSKPERFCKRCGKGPLARDQKDYCSRECAGADASEFKRNFMGIPAEARKAISVANFFHEWDSQRPEWMECEICGKAIERQTRGQRICGSNSCRHRLQTPLHEHCEDCGADLNAETRHTRRCESCKRKRRNAWKKIAGKTPRKRCKRHGVPCDPSVRSRAVFERDGYICQLCWRRCLDKFTVVDDVPDPQSPTVDHIIAISLGIKGHTWDNVQCACWECNVAKGAKALGQLRLAVC